MLKKIEFLNFILEISRTKPSNMEKLESNFKLVLKKASCTGPFRKILGDSCYWEFDASHLLLRLNNPCISR
jgi:hypothetical protein